MKVAVAQIQPDYMNKDGSIDIAAKAVEKAARKGADVIAFPETFIPGYPYWRGFTGQKWAEYMLEYQKNSVRIPDDLTAVMEAAKDGEIGVVLGVSELDGRAGSLTLYNTIVYISKEGEMLGKHRKLMPTHGERMVWGMGDGRDIEVHNFGKAVVGGLICYENHMTPFKTVLALKGEEVHFALWPGYWVSEGTTAVKRRFDPEKDRIHQCDVDCAVREYAFETQTFVVSANTFMEPDALPEGAFDIAAGGSAVVNPSSLYVVEPVLNREELIFAELNMEERMVTKAYFDCVGHYSRWDVVEVRLKAEDVLHKIDERLRKQEMEIKRLERLVEEFVSRLESKGV